MIVDKTEIKNKVEAFHTEAFSIYQYLHQHPELSFQEKETSAFIAKKLRAWGIETTDHVGGYGVLGIIEGEKPGKTIALRADMDALPIKENSNLSFSSLNEGVMHACGHDFHTTALLACAHFLSQHKAQLKGTVLLIFQPAEERAPGGAKAMIDAGIFKNHTPDVVIGQHVLPELTHGQIAVPEGNCMASADELYITVNGKGGHAALPHNCNDTVLASARLICDLQQIISREIPATVPATLSFGHIHSDGSANVLPNSVKIAGTLRLLDESWRNTIKERIKEVCKSSTAVSRCTCDIEIREGYPVVFNHAKPTQQVSTYLKELLGPEKVHPFEPRMTAEDFSYYAQLYPAVFYRVGVKDPQGTNQGGLHTPTFYITEESLKTAIAGLIWLSLRFLEN